MVSGMYGFSSAWYQRRLTSGTALTSSAKARAIAAGSIFLAMAIVFPPRSLSGSSCERRTLSVQRCRGPGGRLRSMPLAGGLVRWGGLDGERRGVEQVVQGQRQAPFDPHVGAERRGDHLDARPADPEGVDFH